MAATEYWVVVVTEETTPENQGQAYRQRFMFEGVDAGPRAVACWASAMANGFKAHTEHVVGKEHREEELQDA